MGVVVSCIMYSNYYLSEEEQILKGIDYINEFGFNIERNINNKNIIKNLWTAKWIISFDSSFSLFKFDLLNDNHHMETSIHAYDIFDEIIDVREYELVWYNNLRGWFLWNAYF